MTLRLRPHSKAARRASGALSVAKPASFAGTLAPFGRRFALAGAYFLVVFLIGATGYVRIEGWDWLQAIYMSVTTVTSVGFMEVRPLSPQGRWFTMGLIALGVTGLGIWWALTTALIVELDLGGVLRRRRTMKQLASMSKHYIVCGAGRVGRVVMAEMLEVGKTVVVIEKLPERVSALEELYPDVVVINGDATTEHVLTLARVQEALGLAACLADDAENLLVCLTARDLKPDLNTVARAYSEESLEKLRRAGADHVISPTITGGIRMASTLLRPNVVSFLDSATIGPDIDLRLEEAAIPEGSQLSGRSLADAQIPQRTGLVVLALRRGRREQIYNPGPDIRLSAGDVMIVLGREDQVQQLRDYASGEATDAGSSG